MRLALHIFRKDIRRLWWETLVATGALAYLAHMDANRMDFVPGPMEGIMNLVVPAAWAYLIAMLIHQEPLVGDRQFWLTRPYPRASLLAAKLLFVLCFVHLPSLFFDAAIVQARGFDPLAHLPALLLKQGMLAAALSLPAIALAAVTKNPAQFASAGLICIVVGYLLTTNIAAPWIRRDPFFEYGAAVLIGLGALPVITLQYRRRRVGLARMIAVAAFAGVLLLAAYLPKRYVTAATCSGGPQITVTVSEHADPSIEDFRFPQPGTLPVAVPIAVTGAPPENLVRLSPITFEIVNSRGEHWSMPDIALRQGGTMPNVPVVYPWFFTAEGKSIGWLVLRIDRNAFAKIIGGPVRLRGTFGGTVTSIGQAREMTVETYGAIIPGVGRCANFMVQNFMSMYRGDMLKAVCESPDEIPRARVELLHAPTGRKVRQGLGDAGTHMGYPTRTWLSPVHRRNSFFHVSEMPLQGAGSRWLVMRTEIPDSKLEFTPIVDAGCSIAHIDFPNIDLNRYILQTPQAGVIR